MLTLSKSKGTGGVVKSSPEDFIVNEITSHGHALVTGQKYAASDLDEEEITDGKFTTFVLQKRNWDTVGALIRISKLTGHGKKSIGYAGTKDRQSVSTQLASIYGVEPERLLGIRLKDVSINGAWRSNGVELGSNIGNSFSVKIHECKPQGAEGVLEELGGMAPNYFDRQRFGMRLNNFAVGMHILKGDFNAALMEFLTDTNLETNEDAISARNKLAETRAFGEALAYFPRYLKNERMAIEYMSRYDNPANALRRLPRGVLMMFIHSVQSYLFNASLEARIADGDLSSNVMCGRNAYGFPDAGAVASSGDFAMGSIPGYETKPDTLKEYEKDRIDDLGITLESFKIKSMPELSMRGSYRTLLTPVKDISHSSEGSTLTLNFSIPSGSYATIFLNEITKSDSFSVSEIPAVYEKSLRDLR